MNKKAALCIMFASFIILIEGNTVTLLPDGFADVISGQPLTLECVYSGIYSPFTFNFYWDPDTIGLQIRISNCRIVSAIGYNTSLYTHSCGTNNVSLTILTVPQEYNGRKWDCDVAFQTAVPIPAKDSTTIRVTAATTPIPTTGTTTKETVTSTSSSSTSMSSTTINATTNNISATHTATGSTATASISTSSSTNSATGSTATTSVSTSSSTNSATGSTATASASSSMSASKSPTAGSTVNGTSTSKPTTPETIGSTGSTSTSPTNTSSQGGTDTKVIIIAVVVPIGGLLLIVIIVLCIWHHWTGKKGHEIPDGMAAQDRGNNVDGFKHDRTAKQLYAIPTTSDDFIIYPGPVAMSTARPNKERKYLDVGYQYKTPYTGYKTAYVPSNYPSSKSSTHKDTKHHNVGHPYSRPYTGTYDNQTAYSPKNKSFDYESPYQIAASRPAYNRTAYYPQTGYYEQIGQDVYQRGSGQYSYGQRSRPRQDHNGRQQQREYYYNQYEMADYGGSRTRYGQTKQYGLDTAIFY